MDIKILDNLLPFTASLVGMIRCAKDSPASRGRRFRYPLIELSFARRLCQAMSAASKLGASENNLQFRAGSAPC